MSKTIAKLKGWVDAFGVIKSAVLALVTIVGIVFVGVRAWDRLSGTVERLPGVEATAGANASALQQLQEDYAEAMLEVRGHHDTLQVVQEMDADLHDIKGDLTGIQGAVLELAGKMEEYQDSALVNRARERCRANPDACE